MQIFLSNFRYLLLVFGLTIFFGCGAGDEMREKEPILPDIPESDQSGTVSGTITDAISNKPISGAVVYLLDREVKSGTDGTFTLSEIPYAESLTITVEDSRYQTYTQTFSVNQEQVIVLHLQVLCQEQSLMQLRKIQFLELL